MNSCSLSKAQAAAWPGVPSRRRRAGAVPDRRSTDRYAGACWARSCCCSATPSGPSAAHWAWWMRRPRCAARRRAAISKPAFSGIASRAGSGRSRNRSTTCSTSPMPLSARPRRRWSMQATASISARSLPEGCRARSAARRPRSIRAPTAWAGGWSRSPIWRNSSARISTRSPAASALPRPSWRPTPARWRRRRRRPAARPRA